MIRITPYDESWPVAYEYEAKSIRTALGTRAIRIEHVGSTSISGLAAKPVIDIQISVASLEPIDAYINALARLDYRFVSLGEFDLIYPFFAKPGQWPSTHHIHVCLAGGEQERKHIAFRDYLRQNPEVVADYAALKQRLAVDYDGTTLESIERYSLAKTQFVNTVLAKAGCTWVSAQ